MGKVSIACLVISTAVVLATFGQAIGGMRGGDMHSHLYWAMGTLMCVLSANAIAIIHAAQSDRIIRALRQQADAAAPGDGLNSAPQL
jgi:hypothetical protein